MPERIQQLSAAMAAGNSDAVDAFYREYFDWMYWQARRVTRRDESFCLDVVQDAVLRVIRTVKALDSESRFRGWLRLVVQTTAFDLLRSERRRKNREAMAGPVADDVDVDSLQLDWLEQQIAALDPEILNIIELRFERSWSLRKIGETLGISVGAVDGRLRRALRNLKLSADEPALPVLTTEAVEVPVIAATMELAIAGPHDVVSPQVVPLDLPDAVATPAVELAVVDRPQSPVPFDVTPLAVVSPGTPDAVNAPVIELSILGQNESRVESDARSPEGMSSVVLGVVPAIAVDRAALDQIALDLPSNAGSVANELVLMPIATSPVAEKQTASVDSPAIGVNELRRSAARGPVSVTTITPVEPAPVEDEPVISTMLKPVVMDEEMEWPELVGLEDEAGRHDDAL